MTDTTERQLSKTPTVEEVVKANRLLEQKLNDQKAADLKAFVMHNMPEGPIAESHNNKWVWNRKRHYAQIDATIEACRYALERLEEQE